MAIVNSPVTTQEINMVSAVPKIRQLKAFVKLRIGCSKLVSVSKLIKYLIYKSFFVKNIFILTRNSNFT